MDPTLPKMPLNDAETMIHSYLRHGLAPGGHRDDRLDHTDGIGCGAIDGLDTVVTVMTDPDLVDDHKRLVRTLMGASFDRDNYLRVLGAALMLRAREDIRNEKNAAITDMKNQLGELSIQVAERILREKLGDKSAQDALLDKVLKESDLRRS